MKCAAVMQVTQESFDEDGRARASKGNSSTTFASALGLSDARVFLRLRRSQVVD